MGEGEQQQKRKELESVDRERSEKKEKKKKTTVTMANLTPDDRVNKRTINYCEHKVECIIYIYIYK